MQNSAKVKWQFRRICKLLLETVKLVCYTQLHGIANLKRGIAEGNVEKQNQLASIEQATRMLAEASTLSEVRKIRDIATAAEQYAKAAKLGEEAENHAARLRAYAGRKAGEMLRQAKEAGELGQGLYQKSHPGTFELSDLGITKNQSSAWQTMATATDEEFEEAVNRSIEFRAKSDRAIAARVKQLDSDPAPLIWTDDQISRRLAVLNGQTVLANKKTDTPLIEWAISRGVYVDISRSSIWGNPFIVDSDGTRAEVIDNYAWYLERKPSLLKRIDGLQGKLLGCWCYPDSCHGDVLEGYCNG